MSLILNEHEWVEHHLEIHSLGDSPTKTINKLAKYYNEQNYSKKEIRELIETFIAQCDPSVSIVKWNSRIDKAVKTADKNPLIKIDNVDIYENELESIKRLGGARERRLAFTLLCVSKYWDKINPNNNHWVNTPDNEVMSMANIKTSIKSQSILFNKLADMRLITFSKKVDNLNVQVLFTDESGDVAMRITDFRNLGYQYMKYYGGDFYVCQNCGITVKDKKRPSGGRAPKYCPDCAVDVHMKSIINSVARSRAAKSDNTGVFS